MLQHVCVGGDEDCGLVADEERTVTLAVCAQPDEGVYSCYDARNSRDDILNWIWSGVESPLGERHATP